MGSKLGKYRILGRVGSGAFATVYKARDTIQDIRVALKVYTDTSGAPELLRSLQEEARLHSRLEHPNILQVKTADWIDGRFVIVYPLGVRSLADRMRFRMSMETFLALAEQMLEAVAHAHEHRIIHCDLKPENFVLFEDDVVCLSDFGISKLALRTVQGSGSGTLGYMAPEQAMGRASFRSDVFSLGLILWEMLASELPEWPFEWPFPGHERVRRKAHPELVALLRRALSVDPRRRFADAGRMFAAFVRLKPAVRRFAGRSTRKVARSRRDGAATDWQEIRFRQFAREFGRVLRLEHTCRRCAGPMSEAMDYCPWCGVAASSRDREAASFPARCPRCHRGRKLDWRYCAWCYGPKFERIAARSYTDRRYTARCGHSTCRGPLMPFMRYCPWCRRKVTRSWLVPGSRERCPSCGWGVARHYWSHCPWCSRKPRS